MFERAKLFREKYTQVKIANDTAAILASQHKNLSERVSALKYKISLMSSEYDVLNHDINEFLMLYYERFSEELFINEDLLAKYNAKRGDAPEDKMNENVALYERKKKARESELKSIYRKLVKEVHPDVKGEDSDRDFVMVNNLYNSANLEGLIAMQTEIQNQKFSDDLGQDISLVREVEMMESQEILLNRKFTKVKIKLSKLISSPEYKLYTRYKIADIRGEDFFDTLLKSI